MPHLDSSDRFLPASPEDFSLYARNLGRLLDVPLQKAQIILAKLYGYADLHELQQRLKVRGNCPPGPYDSDLDGLPRSPYIPAPSRIKRFMAVMASSFGVSELHLPGAVHDAFEIGLFEAPFRHRQLYRALKAKHQVHLGHEPSGTFLTPGDYATALTTHGGKAVRFEFTELGQSILAALGVESRYRRSAASERGDAYSMWLLALAKRHPNNPWVQASVLILKSQTGWTGPWLNGYSNSSTPQAHPGFARYSRRSGAALLPLARHTIALFDELFEGVWRTASRNSIYIEGTWASYYWSSSLYFAGRAAQCAGENSEAEQWYRMNLRVTSGTSEDTYRSRAHLAEVLLSTGKGSVRALFPVKQRGYCQPMDFIALAAEALTQAKRDLADQMIAKAITECPYALEPLGRAGARISTIEAGRGATSLAEIQEFFYFTRAFWSREQAVRKHLEAVANDKMVIAAILAYHQLEKQRWGLSDRPGREKLTARITTELPALGQRLRSAIGAVNRTSMSAFEIANASVTAT